LVWRGRMVERPKPSITLEMRVRTSAELLVEDCKSRETCARRWLVRRGVSALFSEKTAVSVRTDSSPFSERPKFVMGLAGRRTRCWSPVARRADPEREVVARVEGDVGFQEAGVAEHLRLKVPAQVERCARWRRPDPCRCLRSLHDGAAPGPSPEQRLHCRYRTNQCGHEEDVLVEAGEKKTRFLRSGPPNVKPPWCWRSEGLKLSPAGCAFRELSRRK